MPKRADYILGISIKNIEDFSPQAVAYAPRTARPNDVVTACANVDLTGQAPATIRSLARFACIDFFALAHSSGLYNRQLKLWEALAKTATVEARSRRKGLLQSEPLPSFEIQLLDQKGRLIALAYYLAPERPNEPINFLRCCKDLLKAARQAEGALGIFLCCPAPYPEQLLKFIKKETNAQDSISRYESVLPKLGIPVNLAEMDATSPPDRDGFFKVRLVHPEVPERKPATRSLSSPGENTGAAEER